MAKYGANSVVIEFDNSVNALVNMSQHITEMNDINIEATLVDSHTYGDSWVEKLFAQLRNVGDITLKGFYDDAAATGPDVIFNDVGNTASSGAGTRTLKVTWGGTKTSTVETWIKSYKRIAQRGNLTMFEVTLSPSGSVVEV